jgi:hypothetical protein
LLLIAFAAALLVYGGCHKPNKQPNGPQLPFNSRSWQAQRNGTSVGKEASRSQMVTDACKKISKHHLNEALIALGPPDWIRNGSDQDSKEVRSMDRQAEIVIGYFIDSTQETSLCLRVSEKGSIEECYTTFWDEKLDRSSRK